MGCCSVCCNVGDEIREQIMPRFGGASHFHMRILLFRCGNNSDRTLRLYVELILENVEKSRVFEDMVHYDFAYLVTVSWRLLSV